MAKGGPSADAREVARRVLRRVERDDAFVSVALDDELDRARLGAADRGLATELCYGVARHRSRLDRALQSCASRGSLKVNPALRGVLRVAAYQLLLLDRVPAHAAVDDAVRAARRVGGPKVAGFVNGLLRKLASDGEPPLPPTDDPVARAAVVGSLPDWIARSLAGQVGPDEVVAVAEALARPAALAIRVNTLRSSPDVVAAHLADEGAQVEVVAELPEALAVTGLGDPAASPSFREGLWTVQDSSAQRVARLVAPAAGERILDACAGVGGKATHLAELSRGQASVDAMDLAERKLARLANTVARLRTPGVSWRVADVTQPVAGRYDAVLLDAPCSGLGVLRRHPEAKWRVSEADVTTLAALQARMLDALASAVRPGGRLVYSVCTFTAAEGAEQIDAFLARHSEFSESERLATWPHRDGGDAFFAARLERGG